MGRVSWGCVRRSQKKHGHYYFGRLEHKLKLLERMVPPEQFQEAAARCIRAHSRFYGFNQKYNGDGTRR